MEVFPALSWNLGCDLGNPLDNRKNVVSGHKL
jgi:hypothetical protein